MLEAEQTLDNVLFGVLFSCSSVKMCLPHLSECDEQQKKFKLCHTYVTVPPSQFDWQMIFPSRHLFDWSRQWTAIVLRAETKQQESWLWRDFIRKTSRSCSSDDQWGAAAFVVKHSQDYFMRRFNTNRQPPQTCSTHCQWSSISLFVFVNIISFLHWISEWNTVLFTLSYFTDLHKMVCSYFLYHLNLFKVA